MPYRGGKPFFTDFRHKKHRGQRPDQREEAGEFSGFDAQSSTSMEGAEVAGANDRRRREQYRRPAHPPHLRGKHIGLYYAQKARERNELLRAQGIEPTRPPPKHKIIPKIEFNPEKEAEIQRLLSSLPAGLFFVDKSGSLQSENSSNVSYSKPSANKYDHIADSHFKNEFLMSINESIDSKIDRLLLSKTSLERNDFRDTQLKSILETKKCSSQRYQKMLEFRKKLPAFNMQQQLLKMIEENQVVVISGETGCGKTTQVSQFILDDYIQKDKGSLCRIVCTQPRRISAIAVAQRVAQERDEGLGEVSVGFQIRLEKLISPIQGSILYCTAGILLQWMQSDPILSEVSHVILDEIHERDITSDFVITLLKGILPKRPDLKLVLMSATLKAEEFSKYFQNCPSTNIPGFTFPVKEFYLEDVVEWIRYSFPPVSKIMLTQDKDHFKGMVEPYLRNLSTNKYSKRTIKELANPMSEEMDLDLIAELIYNICATKGQGAILVFLPGWMEISRLHKILTRNRGFYNEKFYRIIPLHSMRSTSDQQFVFDRPPRGVRKIVLSTNIAETSITIDDIVYVIDCGKIKMKNYDVLLNVETLRAEWVSLANAHQRRGRAGRTQPGECYHLYTHAREMVLDSYPLPEMLRSRLEGVILSIKILQLGAAAPFLSRVMNPPDPRAVEFSIQLLKKMDALDETENLTPLGYHLAKLPSDPQTGKMLLLGALFSCVDPVFSIAASLSFKEAFQIPLGSDMEKEADRRRLELAKGSKSDHILLANALQMWEEEVKRGNGKQFCRYYFLSENILQMLKDMKTQFALNLREMKFLDSDNPKDRNCNVNSHNSSLVKAIIGAGLYPNVAYLYSLKKIGQVLRRRMMTVEDGKVDFHPKSINQKITSFESPIFVYHLKLKSKMVYLHDTTMIYPLSLIFFGESIRFYNQDGRGMVSVGKDYEFECPQSMGTFVMELRKRLDYLLEHMVTHPSFVNWNVADDNGHVAVLRSVAELITYEDEGIYIHRDECDDDDDEDYYEEESKPQ